MSDKTISTAQCLTPTQKLAASRQTLRDALHTTGTAQNAKRKNQPEPLLRVHKTPASNLHAAVGRLPDSHKTNAQNSTNQPLARLKNLQQLRTVLGTVLLRRWNKQPAHVVASVMQPVLRQAIRKNPKYAVGLAAVSGALLVAWQVWGKKKNKI